MPSEFIAFKNFADKNAAEEICDQLRAHNIECHLHDDLHAYVKVIGYNRGEPGITLSIPAEDFAKADNILEKYYAAEIEDVDPSYYLFQFTNEELIEILSNPYDWGIFDVQLAQKILQRKGIIYSSENIQRNKEHRIAKLSEIEKVPVYKILFGYILSVILPPVGLITGFLIVNDNNILPDGKKVYTHTPADKTHGKVMIAVSIIMVVIAIFSVTGPTHLQI